MTDASSDSATDPQKPQAGTSAGSETPAGAGIFGMMLFLASLTMLFAASMLAYIIIRQRTEGLEISLPLVLWFSTFAILISSASIHYAGLSLKADHRIAFRNAMLVTLILGIVFCCIQIPGLLALAGEYRADGEETVYLYGLVLFLIVVHGLHVIGGLIPLGVVTRKAFAGAYGSENREPVRRITMYWHFLDAVWLVMFNLLLFLG